MRYETIHRPTVLLSGTGTGTGFIARSLNGTLALLAEMMRGKAHQEGSMKCTLCSKPIPPGETFCEECGAPAPEPSSDLNRRVGTPRVEAVAPPSTLEEPKGPVGHVGIFDAMILPFRAAGFRAALVATLILGAVSGLLGWVGLLGPIAGILTHIAVTGFGVAYLMAMLRERQFDVLPEWPDAGRWLMPGVFTSLIQFLYILPSALFAGVAAFPIIAAVLSAMARREPMAPGEIVALVGGAGLMTIIMLMVASGLVLLCMVCLPAATLVYARNGRWEAALSIGEVGAVITKDVGRYALCLVILTFAWCLVSTVTGSISGVLLLLPFVGGLVSGAISTTLSWCLGLMSAALLANYLCSRSH